MNPDVIIGTGIVAAAVAGWAANTLAIRLGSSFAAVEADVDELVKVAAAMGVYIDRRAGGAR